MPDISISIRWYHVSEDNQDHPISDELQEIVKREEEQIVGSYLTIPQVMLSHYGRYMCRVEMGNSQLHRLEMSAELINSLPIEAHPISILWNPYFLASCAAVLTVSLFFLVMHTQLWWKKHLIPLSSNELEILNMKIKNLETTNSLPKNKKSSKERSNSSHDDTRVMIDVV